MPLANLMNPGCCGCGGGSSGGGGTIPYPGCSCNWPATLTMVSNNTSANYGTYQNATIQYGPTPACLSGAALGTCSWTSTTMFPDSVRGTSFYYYLHCYYNQVTLVRIYCPDSNGFILQEGIFNWLINNTNGNTCSPFALTNGNYPGTQGPTTSSLVTITAPQLQNRIPGC